MDNSRQSGFLMMEILVSILLITTFLSMTGFYWNSLQTCRVVAQKKLQALEIIEELKNSFLYQSVPHGATISQSDEFSVVTTIKPYIGDNSIQASLQQITITVSWITNERSDAVIGSFLQDA